jgi:hypothetical protein
MPPCWRGASRVATRSKLHLTWHCIGSMATTARSCWIWACGDVVSLPWDYQQQQQQQQLQQLHLHPQCGSHLDPAADRSGQQCLQCRRTRPAPIRCRYCISTHWQQRVDSPTTVRSQTAVRGPSSACFYACAACSIGCAGRLGPRVRRLRRNSCISADHLNSRTRGHAPTTSCMRGHWH